MSDRSAYFRQWYAKNRERVIAKARAWELAHPEETREKKRKWQDKDGQDRYSLELNVNALDLDSKKSEETEPVQRSSQGSTRSNDIDSDIPFAPRRYKFEI